MLVSIACRFSVSAATLVWDECTTYNDGSPFAAAGYVVWIGEIPHVYSQWIDVGNVTSYALTNLVDKTTYYLAVTAYDADGQQSDYSDEISYLPWNTFSVVTISDVHSEDDLVIEQSVNMLEHFRHKLRAKGVQ